MEDLLPNMLTWPDNANENTCYYLYIQAATNSYRYCMERCQQCLEQWATIIPARDGAVFKRSDSRSENILHP